MENPNNTGKIIGALLVGAAIGGVLGILFAPDKGSETRKKIAGKTDDFTDTLKEKINSLFDEAKKEFESEKGKTA
ncbi:MAG: YtxH domain-containing protein [Bacteroidia bacterium]